MSTLNLFEDPTRLERKKAQILELIGEDWYRQIGELFYRPYMNKLIGFVAWRRKVTRVYPSSPNVFRAYKLTPYKHVRVVILGQDPYPDGSADGLAFSCPGKHVPKSLQIIFKEIKRTHPEFNDRRMADLTDWAQQGVLLINTLLTVDSDAPNSHKDQGWEEFTTEVIKRLNKHTRRLVFVLWGGRAKAYSKYIDKSYHVVLESNHPVSEAYGTGVFTGNNHFLEIDKHLEETAHLKIKWS